MSRLRLLPCALLLASALAFAACGNDVPVIEIQGDTAPRLKDNMIRANRIISEAEETTINGYITRRGWNAVRLACGARMVEYEQGSGAALQPDEAVTVTYRLSNLADKTFYTGQQETFRIGRYETTVGLDDAVAHLRHGSKAYVIVPSSLGYGVAGDGDRIPSRTVLLYDLVVE